MVHLIIAILLALVCLAAISLQKTYSQLPLRELKRRAQKGDDSAQMLFKAASYGLSLRLLLWSVIGLSAAILFLVIARWFAWPLSLLAIIGLLWLGFAWLPTSRVTAFSNQLAGRITPVIAWVLNYLHPLLQSVGTFIRRHSVPPSHTRLYQKEDLLELLEQQAAQADNRMSRQELEIASHALTFGSKLVRDIFTPQSQVKMVKLDDPIGPVLMDELHDSGHTRFPVYDGKKQNVVGLLYLRDLLKKGQGGSVKDIAKKPVNYVHEEQTLYQTLQAFLKTKRHLFVVVNRFEEVLGIVTIEDVLEQIIGQPIVDEFDKYEDLRAVAARMADKIHKQQNHQTPTPPSEPPPKSA